MIQNITQRYQAMQEDLKKHFGALYTLRDFESAFRKYDDPESDKDERITTVANIQIMLEGIGLKKGVDFPQTPPRSVTSIQPYKQVIEKINREDPARLSPSGLSRRVFAYLCKQLNSFADPERYMDRLVDVLTFDEDRAAWQHHPLRTRILLQCIKYGNYLKAAGYQGERAIREQVQHRLHLNSLPDQDAVIAHLNDGDVAAVLERMQTESDQVNAYRAAFDNAQKELDAYFAAYAKRRDLTLADLERITETILHMCDAQNIRAQAEEAEQVWQRAVNHLPQAIREYCAVPLAACRKQFLAVLEQFQLDYLQDRIEHQMFYSLGEFSGKPRQFAEARAVFTAHTGRALNSRPPQGGTTPFALRKAEGEKRIAAVLEKALNHYRDNTAKNRLKDIRRRYKLITMADDLATGKFRAQGGTRTDLYIFALMFDMVYTPPQDDDQAPATLPSLAQVDRSLFVDYYQNNLLRTISDAYRQKASAYESEPSGQRINFKFYEDVVFVYHIARKYDHLPQAQRPLRKLEDVMAMLEALKNAQGTQDAATPTQQWRSDFNALVLTLPPEEFRNHVAKHYDCRPQAIHGSAATQNSAFANYQKLREDIRRQQMEDKIRYHEPADPQPRKAASRKRGAKADDAPRYDLTPIKLSDEEIELGLSFMPAEIAADLPNAEAVRRLLVGTERFLRGKDNGCQWLNITDPKDVTRTSLVTAYYYLYLMRNGNLYVNQNPEMRGEYILGEKQTGVFFTLGDRSFADIFDAFVDYLDPMLEASGYTPFSIRNIYDLLLVLSAYVYFNPV